MKGKFLRDLSALWMGKPHLLIPYWSRSCIFHKQTAVYYIYFRWQSCLRQRPCHGMVLAVPRLRWMMYVCFPAMRQKPDFVFKFSTEEQEGFKSCVVMVQALEKALCNHHLTGNSVCSSGVTARCLLTSQPSKALLSPGQGSAVDPRGLTETCGFST